MCFHFPHNANEVIAAHGDSVLIRIVREERYNYFVYNVGTTDDAGSPQPPSLSLLPPCSRYLAKDKTGILRRGEDELVVARLEMIHLKDETPTKHVAEVVQFRSGAWYIEWPRISGVSNGTEEEMFLSSWFCWSVIPVGDDMLCWVSLHRGLIFSKVYNERLTLQYVPLPEDASCTEHFYSSRNVCVTAVDTVKFVNIFARCCCGGAGGCKCQHSQHAYLIKTWTLRMDSMTWVIDGMMDATGLWALNAYKSLPRIQVGLLPGGSNSEREIEPQQVAIDYNQLKYDASNTKLLPSCCKTSAEREMHASEIFVALQEISSYGLEVPTRSFRVTIYGQIPPAWTAVVTIMFSTTKASLIKGIP
ncbi:hypothetical protein EJB05_50664, partial [Eragrostis curvula]